MRKHAATGVNIVKTVYNTGNTGMILLTINVL